MFEHSAEVYDGFYDALDKDYRWEAGRVLQLVRAARRPDRRPVRTLLDVACGTGRHLEVFSRTLRCTGVDIDPAMLAVARRRCRGVRLVEADMATFDLGARFDVVTCLFSSVAYMPTVAGLRRAVAAMAAHLAPGGVLVIEPWFEPEEWENGYMAVLVVDEPERKAARVSRSSRRGSMSVIDFDYVIADRRGTRHATERHELRLFRRAHYVGAMEAVGLTVTEDEYGVFGRGLLLGRAAG